MKNYKILENRPELTKEQLTQTMDFNKIKINASVAKNALLKSLLIKGVIGVASIAIIGSGIFIYKNNNQPKEEKQTSLLVDSTHQVNSVSIDSLNTTLPSKKDTVEIRKDEIKKIPIAKNPIVKLNPDSLSQAPTALLTESAGAVRKKDSTKTRNIVDTTHSSIVVKKDNLSSKTLPITKGIKVNSCKIYKTSDFCNLPKAARFATSVDCNECEFDEIDCGTIKKQDNYTIVWLTITAGAKSSFQIESNLKNFILQKANGGKSYSPVMISVAGDKKYYGANFKAKSCTANYKKQMDLFMFFKNAEVGDIISIKNFVKAYIEH